MTNLQPTKKVTRCEGEQTTSRTLAQAQAASRAKLAARGGRLVQVRLEPDAVAALDRIKQRFGIETDKDAIIMALLYADEAGDR